MSPDAGRTLRLSAAVDARDTYLFQIPAVILHSSVLATLGVAELSLVTVEHHKSGRTFAAWIVGDDDEHWETVATPRAGTARLSLAACRHLAPYGEVLSGDVISISVTVREMPVGPAHIERLTGGDEMGLHESDAAALGIDGWAFVNHGEIPAVCQVLTSRESRDLGVARLSYQTRVLLGITADTTSNPRLQISPLPIAANGGPLFAAEPRWATSDGMIARRSRLPAKVWTRLDDFLALLLGAPPITLRTVEAGPGEDQAITVRLPEELFPLLGATPGDQVYVEWGSRNRTVARALTAHPPEDAWPSVQMIGRRPRNVAPAPAVAMIHLGAATRAALGIPRVTVVTVRRRVSPLIVARLNQLIIPATGLFIGLAARIKLHWWEWTAAGLVTAALLLAPLRIRLTSRGRMP